MINTDTKITPQGLLPEIDTLFELSARKIRSVQKSWDPGKGAPVFTAAGTYTARGWTEWTQGFQFGSMLLQFDATGEKEFLDIGRNETLKQMAAHVSHTGVHDHGFNNISTYGNLHRLIREERIKENIWERRYYEMALSASGAVQAARWTDLNDNLGYIYSFNGPHSLFADTIRSLRSLLLAHQLGHCLMGEKDRKISLLHRALTHADATARYTVYYGDGRDIYDVRGRVAHESIFNLNDGSYRCPNSQQGYSPFTTWTRGLAWVICGFAEILEFLDELDKQETKEYDSKKILLSRYHKAVFATADFYIEHAPTDGIPYWDTGAPGISSMAGALDKPSDPYNDHEPVDSSAAAIAAQGFIRLGNHLRKHEDHGKAEKYFQTGLTIARQLFSEPYLSTDENHQGLILHSVYHRPNGWDYIPPGRKTPSGESTMWGDYHARELALLISRIALGKPYYKFFI